MTTKTTEGWDKATGEMPDISKHERVDVILANGDVMDGGFEADVFDWRNVPGETWVITHWRHHVA